jgi:hypothetical protein
MVRGTNNGPGKRVIVEPSIVEILCSSVGTVVTIDDLMVRLPAGANPASVRKVMQRLIEDGRMDMTVISRGNSWRVDSLTSMSIPEPEPYMSEKANPDAGKSLGLFEQVGEMQDGSLVVRDEHNRLYALKAL